MVFIFGYDVPLIEFFVVINASILLLGSGIIYMLRKMYLMNKKMDKILGEEKVFQKELAQTKADEDEQLDLMRKMVTSMANLTKIGLEENRKLTDIKRKTMRQIRVAGKSGKHAAHFEDIVKILDELDNIHKKENNQLKFIQDMANALRKAKINKKFYNRLTGMFKKKKK